MYLLLLELETAPRFRRQHNPGGRATPMASGKSGVTPLNGAASAASIVAGRLPPARRDHAGACFIGAHGSLSRRSHWRLGCWRQYQHSLYPPLPYPGWANQCPVGADRTSAASASALVWPVISAFRPPATLSLIAPVVQTGTSCLPGSAAPGSDPVRRQYCRPQSRSRLRESHPHPSFAARCHCREI